jgi:hypothetical protein
MFSCESFFITAISLAIAVSLRDVAGALLCRRAAGAPPPPPTSASASRSRGGATTGARGLRITLIAAGRELIMSTHR